MCTHRCVPLLCALPLGSRDYPVLLPWSGPLHNPRPGGKGNGVLLTVCTPHTHVLDTCKHTRGRVLVLLVRRDGSPTSFFFSSDTHPSPFRRHLHFLASTLVWVVREGGVDDSSRGSGGKGDRGSFLPVCSGCESLYVLCFEPIPGVRVVATSTPRVGLRSRVNKESETRPVEGRTSAPWCPCPQSPQ